MERLHWRRVPFQIFIGLTNDDYEYLIQYVENIKTGVPNDKMLILAGPPRTGKTMVHLFALKMRKGNVTFHSFLRPQSGRLK
jgi:SpoVK/Ycf46/Vps4 family AAA+-type ATPase